MLLKIIAEFSRKIWSIASVKRYGEICNSECAAAESVTLIV